jgi:ribonuclease HI
VTFWIYTAVVLPGILYGSVVWASAANVNNKIKKLKRVQNCALHAISGTMRSTPQLALEVLLCLLPIDLKLLEHAIATMHQLKLRKQWLSWAHMGVTKRTTHIMVCEETVKQISEMDFPCDYSRSLLPLGINFKILIRSREQWKDTGFPWLEDHSQVFFTDGSRINESSGAAYWENQNAQALIPLGRNAIVFQSEIMAIIELASFLTENLNQVIHIFVDSMSVLNSLQTGWKTSSLVKEYFQKLSRLSSANSVTLHWIPAHSGFDGNECVDKLAKEAASMTFVGPESVIAVSCDYV